jgi:glycosyltransferase involved in cell wall biosynthesis
MEKISAVIITKNEAANIERCLNSIKEVVDEIIVIDSFSTDNTKEICEKFNVKFIPNTFVNYSQQKNFGIDQASNEIILSLDADEALEETLKNEIKNTKNNFTADGYFMNRLTSYCGSWIKHGGWYPDKKLRLFRKSKSSWQGEIHETVACSTNNTKHLHGDILHYSYPSISWHVTKMNSFTDMAAREMFQNGKKANTLKILFGPSFEFYKKYFLKGGFRDGYYGFVIAVLSGYYVFLKYAKLKSLWLKK